MSTQLSFIIKIIFTFLNVKEGSQISWLVIPVKKRYLSCKLCTAVILLCNSWNSSSRYLRFYLFMPDDDCCGYKHVTFYKVNIFLQTVVLTEIVCICSSGNTVQCLLQRWKSNWVVCVSWLKTLTSFKNLQCLVLTSKHSASFYVFLFHCLNKYNESLLILFWKN